MHICSYFIIIIIIIIIIVIIILIILFFIFLFFCIQLIKRDEEASGMLMRARRPRAVVMCPTRELSEQVIFPIENAIIIQFEGVIITSTNLWDVLSGISSCKMY